MKITFLFQRALFASLFALIILTFSNCKQDSSSTWSFEKEDKNYQRAQRLYREKKYEEALCLFLKVIDSHKEAPESHLETGRLYLEHIQDPITAIYHFRKYLEYKPNAEQSPMVKQMIERSKKEFARSLPGQSLEFSPLTNNESALLIQELKSENRFLKNQLESIRKINTPETSSQKYANTPLKVPERSLTPPKQNVSTASYLTYMVVPGDTLSSISKKLYGKTNQWEKIYNLNRDQLSTPGSLKIGQILKLPPKEN